jgi:thiol:disulfide interchange protein DsbD
MKFQRLLFVIMLVGLLSAAASAQTSGKVVSVAPEQPVYKVKQGSPFQLAVVIQINDGYHINSNRPTEDYLIATALKFDPLAGLRLSAVRYPKAKMQKFGFSDKPLSVYDGRAVLRVTARALPALTAGSHTLRAKLRVQACNDQLCLRPDTVEISIPIEVSAN